MSNFINIFLPDNTEKQLKAGTSGGELAKIISEKLFKDSIAVEINGEICDLNSILSDKDRVRIITQKNPESLEILRHTCAHVLAMAVQSLYPEAKIAIGPVIENGFYYDFSIENHKLSIGDLSAIENKMQEIINSSFEIEKIYISQENINSKIQEFKSQGEKFKALLLEKYRDNQPSLYIINNTWADLCKGPHLRNTKQIKAFKLLSVSGSYWEGDESKDSLQRIYGTAWWSQKDLDEYINKLEEAEKRDHRKLSKQHDLFSIHEESGAGLIFWHPKLAFLRDRVESFWKQIHQETGYDLVYTPHIAKAELWKISGHLEFYAENMFGLKPIDDQEYILRPMNCPFHVLIYKSQPHSYRELPVRLAECATVYRFERSGVLHGLARVRGFTQDDAHIFCTQEQLVSEVSNIINLINKIYGKFSLEYKAVLSTRPAERIGDNSIWDKAESALQEALEKNKIEYSLNEGDGAFYGPKIDFKLKDAIGRQWQGATVQLDFNLPERFDLNYIDRDSNKQRPVMLHRAIFGSMERFTALLIEHFAGAFPFWLCYTQIMLLPIADRHNNYCEELKNKLLKAGFRVKLDSRAEKINSKIRDAQLEQVPYMLVVGDKELETEQVSVRERRAGDLGLMSLDKFLSECLIK